MWNKSLERRKSSNKYDFKPCKFVRIFEKYRWARFKLHQFDCQWSSGGWVALCADQHCQTVVKRPAICPGTRISSWTCWLRHTAVTVTPHVLASEYPPWWEQPLSCRQPLTTADCSLYSPLRINYTYWLLTLKVCPPTPSILANTYWLLTRLWPRTRTNKEIVKSLKHKV